MEQKKLWENGDAKPLLHHFDYGIIFVDVKTDIWLNLMDAEQFSGFIVGIIRGHNKVLPVYIGKRNGKFIGKWMIF